MLSLLRLSSDALKDYELREKDGLAGKYSLVFMSPEKLLKPNKVPLLWCWRRWYALWLFQVTVGFGGKCPLCVLVCLLLFPSC